MAAKKIKNSPQSATASRPRRRQSLRRTTPVAPKVVHVRREPTHDEIAARAYALWQQRGGTAGNAREDWLIAEMELFTGLQLGRL